MKLWHAGEFMYLLKEAETIQKDLRVPNTPSTIDADGWKRIFTSNQFGKSSNDLCKTLAEVIKKLCTTEDL